MLTSVKALNHTQMNSLGHIPHGTAHVTDGLKKNKFCLLELKTLQTGLTERIL